MVAEMITPVDRVTGLVLPIAPRCEWIPLDNPVKADIHHGNHPCRDPGLKTLAGLALRNSQLQWMERELHNEGPKRLHRWLAGPPIPTDEDVIFRRCVFACAGVIPDEVIDLSGDEPFTRFATPKEKDFLRTPSEDDPFGYRYIKYRYEPIRDFLRVHAARQPLGHLKEGRIEEFLLTKNPERKLVLGKFLLANAAAVASDSLREGYSWLRRQNKIHPAMPADPQTLVYYKLGLKVRPGETQPQAFNYLEDHLRTKVGLGAASLTPQLQRV